MSMHRIPLTELERAGLVAHGLAVGKPSQLSDVFRHGVKWAQDNSVPQWIPVSDPPNDSRDFLCLKPSGTRVIDYYRNGRFQLSGDYVMWQELPAAPVKDSE